MTKAGDRKEELMTPLTLGTPNQPLRKASMMSQGQQIENETQQTGQDSDKFATYKNVFEEEALIVNSVAGST